MPQWRSKYTIGLVVGFLVLGGLGSAFLKPPFLFSSAASPSTTFTPPARRAPAGDRKTVQCLGRLEPGRGVVNVSAGEGTRIDKLLIVEGQLVKEGDLLATTEAHPELAAEKKHAESQLKEAREQLEAETRRGKSLIEEADLAVRRVKEVVCHEILAQKATVRLNEAQLEEARRDFARSKTLRNTSSASREEYDRYEIAVSRMTQQLDVGKANLARLQADQGVALLETETRLATARANLLKAERAIQIDSLDKRVALIDARLERTQLRAPVTGHVLRIFTYPGERIASKPVLQMGETGKMMAVAEVYETDIRFLRAGQRATVTSPALAQELTGTVEIVGQRIYKNDVLNVDPRAETDSRVVEVRIRLDDSSLARHFVYLQVDIVIDVAAAQTAMVVDKRRALPR